MGRGRSGRGVLRRHRSLRSISLMLSVGLRPLVTCLFPFRPLAVGGPWALIHSDYPWFEVSFIFEYPNNPRRFYIPTGPISLESGTMTRATFLGFSLSVFKPLVCSKFKLCIYAVVTFVDLTSWLGQSFSVPTLPSKPSILLRFELVIQQP